MTAPAPRSLADRLDLAGAAAIVVGALALALLATVAGLLLEQGDPEQLEGLADKLVTGLLALLASTRLSRSSTPTPVTVENPEPVLVEEAPRDPADGAWRDSSAKP